MVRACKVPEDWVTTESVAPAFNVAMCTVPATSRVAEGAVVPIPTLVFEESRFKSPPSIFKARVEVLAISTLVGFTKERLAPFMVTVSFEASPKVLFPVVLNDPPTVKVDEGTVVPIPTLEFEASMSKTLLTLKALLTEFRVKATEPEVEVKLSAPVVNVKPFEAVNVEAKEPVEPKVTAPVAFKVPAISRVVEGAVVPMPTAAPVS